MLKYPNLDLLYKACEEANVECAHVYLYRDPHALVKSTTVNRHFNEHVLGAMHLYISMLHIVYGQMARHPTKNLGCFGFLEPNVTSAEVWHPIRDIFGWTSGEKYDKWINYAYKSPHAMNATTRLAIIPENYRVYTDSLVQSHNDVVELCRKQFHDNFGNEIGGSGIDAQMTTAAAIGDGSNADAVGTAETKMAV